MLTALSCVVPRVKYLVAKGAVVRKGQIIKTKFSKYSRTPQGMLFLFDLRSLNLHGIDHIFVTALYTSDIDKVMRYTDEGVSARLLAGFNN